MSTEARYVILAFLVSALAPVVIVQISLWSIAPLGAVIGLMLVGVISFFCSAAIFSLWISRCDVYFITSETKFNTQ